MKVRHVDFYPDEWLVGTASLSIEERGLYVTACALIYSHGGAVETAELRRHFPGHGNAFKSMLSQLVSKGKLVEKRGKLSSKRCETELEKARNRHAKASENGRKRGTVYRKNKRLSEPAAPAVAQLTNQPPTNQPPTLKKEGEEGEVHGGKALRAVARRGSSGPNFADPAVRKQGWEQRVMNYLFDTNPRAGAIITAYAEGDPAAVNLFEIASREMGARERRGLAA